MLTDREKMIKLFSCGQLYIALELHPQELFWPEVLIFTLKCESIHSCSTTLFSKSSQFFHHVHWTRNFLCMIMELHCPFNDILHSSKETQLFWTHFSRWPWVTDPDPGSCHRLYGLGYQEHWQNKIHYKVHLSTLFPKNCNFPCCVSFEGECIESVLQIRIIYIYMLTDTEKMIEITLVSSFYIALDLHSQKKKMLNDVNVSPLPKSGHSPCFA